MWLNDVQRDHGDLADASAEPNLVRDQQNIAEIWARIWFGASICIATVEVGIGEEAKNIAPTSSVSENAKLSTCVKATAGTSIPTAPIKPASNRHLRA